MDEFAGMTQPQCPECGTVLRNVPNGYVCRSCGLAFLPNVDPPK